MHIYQHTVDMSSEPEDKEFVGQMTGGLQQATESPINDIEGEMDVHTSSKQLDGPTKIVQRQRSSSKDISSKTKLNVEPFVEPLLRPDEHRFVMFPIQHHDVWSLYKKSIDCFWKVEDIDLSKDLADWSQLNPDEKHFITMILAFFSSSDGIIIENLSMRFSNEVQCAEVRAFYAFQNFMESVHSEMYSQLIDTYVTDTMEKTKLFQASSNYPCIKRKTDWGKKWISDYRSSFSTRLIAFAIIEGIFLVPVLPPFFG